MKAEEIHKVLMVGVGTMGQQIALICAWHGYQVALYDLHPEILEASVARIRALAQTVVDKESPGHVFNVMLDAILSAAIDLVSRNVATVEDVDRSWMGITGMAAGPSGIMDLVGLDLIYSIVLRKAGMLRFLPSARRTLSLFRSHVEQGELGLKTGEGFYTYPDPAFEQPGFVEGS